MDALLDIPAVPWAVVDTLSTELQVSTAFAQVLARRGLTDAATARAFLEPSALHDPMLMGDMPLACERILHHVSVGSQITVHGDYDCDGVTSTVILVGALRGLGANVDWFLPSRTEDGYGLALDTVARLAERGTQLLITVDCGITAVDEVAAAGAAGMEVIVTDHHQPRADGRLPDAPLVHPGRGGYPFEWLCAAAVAHKLHRALLSASGGDPANADSDLDLVALATVADCVPLRGENRRLVRDGLHAISGTRRPGLRALMRVAQLDPSAVDARALGFRLGPRINAAGRVHRADAGVELMLTDDPVRADEIAQELDRANGERKHVETRILFEAEAQARQFEGAPAFVLAGEGWHPGVIGIVAARIAERHHRPTLMIALDGETGTGSGRSIESFDLLAALDASAEHLLRHGGHRAAAGCTVAADQVDALRAAFTAHAAATLTEEDLLPREHVDAVVAGDELGMALCEELLTLEPLGMGNPEPSLLVPAARLTDVRTMGEGKHVRFTVRSGSVRASAVAFGRGSLPPEAADGIDAAFTLERNEWNGAVEARLRLRATTLTAPAAITSFRGDGEDGSDAAADLALLLAAATGAGEEPAPASSAAPARHIHDRRGRGAAGTIGALVGTGESVLVVCADGEARRSHLAGRTGGFSLAEYEDLLEAPERAAGYVHLVALDPPATAQQDAALRAGRADGFTHLAWGQPELRFALDVHTARHDLRPPLAGLFRALRDRGPAGGDDLRRLAFEDGRDLRLTARLLRVMHELDLLHIDGDDHDVARVGLRPPAGQVDLDASPTFRASATARVEADRWLTSVATQAA